MRRAALIVLVLVAVTVLAGCEAVLSDRPVGAEPAVLNRVDWEGRWLCKGEWVEIRVLDEKEGLLEFRAPEKEGGGTARVAIRQSGDWMFANVRQSDIEGAMPGVAPEPYAWARVQNTVNEIIVWAPDEKKFENLVATGKLAGEVKKGEDSLVVTLKDLAPEQLQMIMSEKEGVLFKWAEPIALVREMTPEIAEAEAEEAARLEEEFQTIRGAVEALEAARRAGDAKAIAEAEAKLAQVTALIEKKAAERAAATAARRAAEEEKRQAEPAAAAVAFEGGDGSSIETAVIVKTANEALGVPAEYKWLKQNRPGWAPQKQAVQSANDRTYDRIDCVTPEGEMKTVFFDITEFFGKN